MEDGVTYVVTSTLSVGDQPTRNFESILVASPREAVEIILAGGSARLPAGSWHLALDVLLALGLSPQEAVERIHFAQTGRILRQS